MKQSIKGLALSAFLGLAALTGCSEQPLGPEDMGGNASAVAAGDVVSTAAARLRANLRATAADPRASGHSDFESVGARRKFSTEVEDVSTDGQGRVVVTRSGQTVLSRAIRIRNGFGDLNLDTQNGQQVPVMRSGDLVRVANPAGVVILQGTLLPD
jgi:hypothetical protein